MFVFLHYSSVMNVLRVSTNVHVSPDWKDDTHDEIFRDYLSDYCVSFKTGRDGWKKPIWTRVFEAGSFVLPTDLGNILNGKNSEIETLIFVSMDNEPLVPIFGWRRSAPRLSKVVLCGVKLWGFREPWNVTSIELHQVTNPVLVDYAHIEDVTIDYLSELTMNELSSDCKHLKLLNCPNLQASSISSWIPKSLRTCRITGTSFPLESAMFISSCLYDMPFLLDLTLENFCSNISDNLSGTISTQLTRLEICRTRFVDESDCRWVLNLNMFRDLKKLVLWEFPSERIEGVCHGLESLEYHMDSSRNRDFDSFISKSYYGIKELTLGKTLLEQSPPYCVKRGTRNNHTLTVLEGSEPHAWTKWVNDTSDVIMLRSFDLVKSMHRIDAVPFWCVDEIHVDFSSIGIEDYDTYLQTMSKTLEKFFPFANRLVLESLPYDMWVLPPQSVKISEWNAVKLFPKYQRHTRI